MLKTQSIQPKAMIRDKAGHVWDELMYPRRVWNFNLVWYVFGNVGTIS